MRIAVVGAGIIGLATTYELVKAGADVVCFEAATPMAARSVGQTRIFRSAHADPSFVEHAGRARELWRTWEQACRRQLIGSQGAVVSGVCAAQWHEAMQQAGSDAELVDRPERLGLPTRRLDGPFLWDPSGGVIQAQQAGAFLLHHVRGRVLDGVVFDIDLVGSRAAVRSYSAGDGQVHSWECDRVVIAAGAATSALAARVDLSTPAELEPHARFSFRLTDAAAVPPCWLDKSGAWREGFRAYSHLAGGEGLWAIGGYPIGVDAQRELGADEVLELSRAVVADYVREYLHGVNPEVVDVVSCSSLPVGDSFGAVRGGPVLAFWGDNVFKMAPLLGRRLATAAISDVDFDAN